MKTVIILPTYNERENIVTLLDALHVEAKKIKNHAITYVIVDDSSPDGTGAVVNEYIKTHKDTYIITGKKEGLGRALLRGMTYAVEELKAEIVIQMDCDLSHDPTRVPLFMAAIDDGADFVVGSRYIKGGSIPDNWGLHRKIFSVLGNAIVRYGLRFPKTHDWTGGYRAYKKKYYELFAGEMKEYSGYVFQIAFLHKAISSGAKIVEVPIHFTDRLYGHSKIAPGEYIKNVLLYVAGSLIHELRYGSFGKFLVVGGIGFVLNAVLLIVFRELVGLSASIANLIGAAVAIFSNFNFNNIWTFKDQKIDSVGKYLGKLIQFYGTSLFGVIVIQTGTIELATRLFGETYYFVYFLIGTSLLLVWNYFMYSRVIWKKRT
ncbi:MAG: glycosyltransferase family 2 protein [Microgenomates group bacterium]